MRIVRLILILCQVLMFIEGSYGSPMLLFANRRDICLVNAGDASNNSTIIINGLEDAAAIDFIFSDQSIFWTDLTRMSIQRTSVNESQILITANHYKPSRQGKNIINTGLHSPDGIACDWLTRKLYWTDSVNNHLEVSNLDGSNRKVLFWENLDEPRAIALDPIRGYMYWTDWGEQPKIERGSMDGNPKSRQVLISKDRIFWPNGLTIDYKEERVYWMDSKLYYIHSMKLDGSDRKSVLENASPYPFAITLFQDHVYWTDWNTHSIHTCNKHTGLDKSEVHKDIHSPMDIHVFHHERQPTGRNPCGSDNGGCSHLCLMSAYQPFYSCACPTGVKLRPDNKTCLEGPEELLLLVRRPDIRRISLDTSDNTDVVLPLQNVRHAMTVDYDPVDKYFYWSDDEVVAISRARLNGTDQETLLSNNIARPDGIAVDWIARNLYWIDTGLKRIEVARLNGSSRRVLITHGLLEPRAIALDPVAGYMYWTDWGFTPKIERANLDGTDRVSIINASLGWPNGIALDLKERKIYWGDAKLDSIEMCDMDGTNRKVLARGDTLPHVFGVTLLDDYVYWTDWQRRRVERIHKSTGKQRQIIIEHLPDLMGIKAINVSQIEGTNPCQKNNSGCSHLCFNTPNGTVCGCPMGFELLQDSKTCIVPDAFLLFSRGKDIRRISLNTVQNNNVPIPVMGIKEAMSLDFDINDKRIYWTDTELKTVSRAFMNGSNVEHVIEYGLNYPEGMAVDWIARNLYWADMGTSRIEMARLDGTSRKVIVWNDIDNPRSIAIDPANGFMYWTDWGIPGNRENQPHIVRASLDGTNREVIQKNVGRANGLTIDYIEGRIYWTNVDEQTIESSNLDGKDRKALVREALPHPYSLTQYEDFIYWADWESHTIERANKTTGENRSTVQNNMEVIMDLLVFHKSRQSGSNPCADNNGGCSHLCVAIPEELRQGKLLHHCTCPTHYTLQDDKRNCKAPDSYLLYSVKNSITRLMLDTNDVQNMILPIKGLRNIKAMTVDPFEGFIYWIDSKSRSIKRIREDGRNYSVVLDNRDKDKDKNSSPSNAPYDLAIDPYGRFLYFTDDKANTINVTSLDRLKPLGAVISGKDQKTKDQKPRKLVLDPVAGLMFWLNGVKPARIEKSRMDGTSQLSLFEHDLGQPCSIAVDPEAQKLYWADCLLKKIEVCNYDGSNRKTLLADNLDQPVGLAIEGQYVYWVDKRRETVKRMDKLTGQNVQNIQNRVNSLSDIQTVITISPEKRLSQPCSKFNGNCSHLCFVEMNGERRCSCPEGLVLKEDYRTCSHNLHCEDDNFECLQDSTCISLKWQCDGDNDCDDGSDELECRQCTTSEFRCENGLCIPKSQRCDGTKNCPFGIDEEMCAPCNSGYWECQDHTCIPSADHCNGEMDCRNGEDEADCNATAQITSSAGMKTYISGIIIAVVVIVLVATLVLILYWYRKKRSQEPRQMDDTSEYCEIILASEPHKKTAKKIYTAPTAPHSLSRGKSGTTCLTMTSGTTPSSNGSPPYDRNHVTGASSSSSTVTHCYPHETLNPPPSPVTDRCSHVTNGDLFSFTSQQSPSSTIRSYNNRHPPNKRRHHHRHPHHHHKLKPHQVAPPTTPCSTDVCDDSEPYLPLSMRKYYPLSDSNYDSDVFYPQPPPTPRSQCFSAEEEHSCPPSPSTERSFFNPYPPPPSPVGNSDC